MKRNYAIDVIKTAKQFWFLLGLFNTAQGVIECPATTILPRVVGLDEDGNHNYKNFDTRFDSIDVAKYQDFIVLGGSFTGKFIDAATKPTGFDPSIQYCGGATCQSELFSLSEATQETNQYGLLLIQSLTSYSDQSYYILDDPTHKVKVAGVRLLNVDPASTTIDVAVLDSEFAMDYSKEVLAAVLVHTVTESDVQGAFYLRIFSIKMEDKQQRVTFKKHFKYGNDINYTAATKGFVQNAFSFDFMFDEDGVAMGPTFVSSLCKNEGGLTCTTNIVSKMTQQAQPYNVKSSFESNTNSNYITISGQKASRDGKSMYFMGKVDSQALIHRVKFSSTPDSSQNLYTIVTTIIAPMTVRSKNSMQLMTFRYIDMAFLSDAGTTDQSDERGIVFLRSNIDQDNAIPGSLSLDQFKPDNSQYQSTTIEQGGSEDHKGIALSCKDTTCIIVLQDSAIVTPGEAVKILKISDMNVNASSNIVSMLTLNTKPSALQTQALTAVVIGNSKTSQMSVFYAENFYELLWKRGSSTQTKSNTNFQNRMSVISSTRVEDCLEQGLINDDSITLTREVRSANAFDPTYESALISSISDFSLGFMTDDDKQTKVESNDVYNWFEHMVFHDSSPDHELTPWFDCALTVANIDPMGDGSYRKLFTYNLSTDSASAKISLGNVQIGTSGSDYKCFEDDIKFYEIVAEANKNDGDLYELGDEVDIIDCLAVNPGEVSFCTATRIFNMMLQNGEYPTKDENFPWKTTMPTDIQEYDGIEIDFEITYNLELAKATSNKFTLAWKYEEKDITDVAPDAPDTPDVPDKTDIPDANAGTEVIQPETDDSISDQTPQELALSTPQLPNPPPSDGFTLQVGQVTEFEIGKAFSNNDDDDIVTLLQVNKLSVTAESCSGSNYCPIQIQDENTVLWMEASDKLFDAINPYTVFKEQRQVDSQEGFVPFAVGSQQGQNEVIEIRETIRLEIQIIAFSTKTLTQTSYESFVNMQRFTQIQSSEDSQPDLKIKDTKEVKIDEVIIDQDEIQSPTGKQNDILDKLSDGSIDTTPSSIEETTLIDDEEQLLIETVIQEINSEETPSIDKITESISEALGIAKPAEVLSLSQSTVQDEDDQTDFEAVAKFDIFNFSREKKIDLAIFEDPNVRSLPPIIIENELKKAFVMPQIVTISMAGNVNFKLSHPVQPIKFELAFKRLSRIIKGQNKLRRSLDEVVEQRPKQKIEAQSRLNQKELQALTQLLKLSESLQVQLVPGQSYNLEQKGFTWYLTSFEGNELSIKLDFENPLEISAYELDTLKFTFRNTEAYLEPIDPAYQPIPSGFEQVVQVPPQSKSAMSEEEIKEVKSQGQQIVITNLLFGLLSKQTMQVVFSSIILVQILAHLPLADIMLPSKALQAFDVMIDIVSFDFFQPTEYFDFGFSDMPAWSSNFEWLSYESINFVDSMGSILIFAIIYMLYLTLAGILTLFKLRCHCKCCKRLKLGEAYVQSLAFMNGTCFEMLICVSISTRMLEFEDYLNQADKASIWAMYFFAAILLFFILKLAYFTFIKTNKLVLLNKAKKLEKNQELRESTLKKFEKLNARQSSKFTVDQVKSLMDSQQTRDKKVIDIAKGIDKSDFEKYRPLYEDLRKDSQFALFYNLFIMIRRLTMLYMAMFIIGVAWLQVAVFMLMNLFSLIFVYRMRPFKSRSVNNLNAILESMSLLVSYFILVINALATSVDMIEVLGEIIVDLIYTSWIVTIVIIAYMTATQAYRACKIWYYKKGRHLCKRFCLRSKDKDSKNETKSKAANRDDLDQVMSLPKDDQQQGVPDQEDSQDQHQQNIILTQNPKKAENFGRTQTKRQNQLSQKKDVLLSARKIDSPKQDQQVDIHRVQDGVSNLNFLHKKQEKVLQLYEEWQENFAKAQRKYQDKAVEADDVLESVEGFESEKQDESRQEERENIQIEPSMLVHKISLIDTTKDFNQEETSKNDSGNQ